MASSLSSQGSQGRVGSYESLDKISNLPQQVIDEILKGLSVKDAAKTCILSRKWRYKWTSLPDLVFDNGCIPNFIEGEERNTYAVNFVNKVLSSHKGTVSEFYLNRALESGCSDVSHWISLLSRKEVKNLGLVFNPSTPYLLPGCLFSCQTLRTLILKSCILELPSQYEGFSDLNYLELINVTLTDDTFESLLLKIPLLVRLTISECLPSTRLVIDAPNLKEVDISGPYESISFRNASKVVKANICLVRCKIDEVLGAALTGLEHLTIYHPSVEKTSPKKLGYCYSHLKDVTLIVNFQDSKQILATLCLCRSSPHIKTLTILAAWNGLWCSHYGDEGACDTSNNFWESRLREEEDVLHNLETLSLKGFKGAIFDMGFAQFILLNAPVLETLFIEWNQLICSEERLQMMDKMMQYHRSSPKAMIIFPTVVFETHRERRERIYNAAVLRTRERWTQYHISSSKSWYLRHF